MYRLVGIQLLYDFKKEKVTRKLTNWYVIERVKKVPQTDNPLTPLLRLHFSSSKPKINMQQTALHI